MLISDNKKFVKTPFSSELELEQVVIDNFEYLFGPSSIYLPKAIIRTADGAGTIPDGFAVDFSSRTWYVVEAELLHHSVWSHIAPQISKQIIASLQSLTKQKVEDLAIEQYQANRTTREKFEEQHIKKIDIRKELREILNKEPIVGIPIDALSADLVEWARTLKYKVKLWTISKYINMENPTEIVYEFPEEFKPVLDTEEEQSEMETTQGLNRYDVTISDLIEEGLVKVSDVLTMYYKPRNGIRKMYEAVILEDGSLKVLEQTYSSPSYAALAGIQDAGSDRKTVNGWTSWKNSQGHTLAELRDTLILQR
jgi:uncharacterized protein (DUF1330 family)